MSTSGQLFFVSHSQTGMAPSFAMFAYKVGDAGGFDETTSDDKLHTMYTRDSEIDYKVGKIAKIADAYANPSTFFTDKSTALKTAGKSAAHVYATEFKALVGKNIPAAMAHNRAKKMADTYFDLLSADVENDFPSNLNDLNLQLHYNKGEATGNNFMQADTKADARPKKQKK